MLSTIGRKTSDTLHAKIPMSPAAEVMMLGAARIAAPTMMFIPIKIALVSDI